MAALLYKDDHNKVAYLEKGKGWEAYEQNLNFLHMSHIRYALTHRPRIVFDSLVKQFWATATVHNHEAGSSKIIATIDGNKDGPHMPLLAPILMVPAGGDGADAVAAGAAAAHDVPPPPPPPIVPPTHSSSSTLGPFTVAHATPVRNPHPSEEVGPTTSTRPSSLTRQTSFQEDISEGGGDFVSSLKSNEAQQTPAATAAGGAEDSAALTALSLKLDRVKQLEGLLQQRKKRLVLSDSEGKEAATKEQDIDLDALHKLASTSLGGDSTVEAAYTIYKASQDAHASSDAGHVADEVPADTMPYRHTLPAGKGIPAAAPTIPAGSTPIPSGSSMDPVGQAAAPSSTIPAANKGKAPMVDDSLTVDLLKQSLPDSKRSWHRKLKLKELLHLLNKVPASVPAILLVAAAVLVPAALSVAADVSIPAVPPDLAAVSTHVDTEVHAEESTPDDNPTASEHIVAASTPSSSRKRHKQIAKKRVTPIVDIADDALIKFDSTSDSDDDPLPYAPYAGWEMVPSPLGSIHAYYDMEGHTKHFTYLRELLHMVEKNDLQKLLVTVDNLYQREEPDTFALLLWGDLHVHVLETVDGRVIYMFVNVSYPLSAATLQRMLKHGLEVPKLLVAGDLTMAEQLVHILETVDGRVIYMFVDVSYPLSAATLEHMLKHGLEVPKLLVGGDLTMAEQLVSFIKAALLNAQSAVSSMVFHVGFQPHH
nr:hypothetical protein [Tanacetum cinerariifolium]